MSDLRPDDEALRALIVDQLRGMFDVSDVGDGGFSLEHDGVVTRVRIGVPELAGYVQAVEESAYDAIGIEPRWRSAVSLTAVHVMEEVAMAGSGTDVVLDGSDIRREIPSEHSHGVGGA